MSCGTKHYTCHLDMLRSCSLQVQLILSQRRCIFRITEGDPPHYTLRPYILDLDPFVSQEPRTFSAIDTARRCLYTDVRRISSRHPDVA